MAVIDGRRIRANVAGRATSIAGTLQDVEPATEDVLEEIPRAGAEDVDAAVARARSVDPAWRAVGGGRAAARAPPRLWRGLAAARGDRLGVLAALEARNAGKPIADARGEM